MPSSNRNTSIRRQACPCVAPTGTCPAAARGFTLIELPFDRLSSSLSLRAEGRATHNAGLRGFTLIELLVVIAIIALLVSILLPSLGRAKDLAREAVCRSNLKSLGLTMRVYVSENHYPNYPQPNAYGNTPGLDFWYETIGQGDSPRSLPLWCPIETTSLQRIEDQGRSLDKPWYYTSYGYNGDGLGGLTTPSWLASKFQNTPLRPEDIDRPAETVVLAESAINPDASADPAGWAKYRPYPDPWNGNPYPRHEDRCNTLWADGHVSPIVALDGTWRSLYWEFPDGFGDVRHDDEENAWDTN